MDESGIERQDVSVAVKNEVGWRLGFICTWLFKSCQAAGGAYG